MSIRTYITDVCHPQLDPEPSVCTARSPSSLREIDYSLDTTGKSDRPRRPQIQTDERFAFDQATGFGSIMIQWPSGMTADCEISDTGIILYATFY